MDEWFAREELLWKQRTKANWLRGGEQNAVFFTVKASRRKERKVIEKLLKGDRTETYDHEEIKEEFVKYFNNLFLSSRMEGAQFD